MLISFIRIIKFAFQNFWRNIWLSIATLSIIVLTLISISSLIFVTVLTNEAINSVKQLVDLNVSFKPEVTLEEVQEIEVSLRELEQVSTTVFISKTEALKEFEAFHKDEELIQESLKELDENPLGHALVVKAKNLEDYPFVLTFFQEEGREDKIQEFNKNFEKHEVILEKMALVTKRGRELALAISIVFVLIAVLIVFNTIRIAIYTHSEEISIMKLVGASNAFVRGPFIFESFWYAFIATAITLALLYPLVNVVNPYINQFFSSNFDLVTYYTQNIVWIGLYEFVGMLLLNLVATSVALGKYLDV